MESGGKITLFFPIDPVDIRIAPQPGQLAFGIGASGQRRGKAALIRRFQVYALIGGHCHAEGGELTKSEWSYMIGLGENRIFVWKQRH